MTGMRRRTKWPKDAMGWFTMIFVGFGGVILVLLALIFGIRQIFWNPEGPAPTEEIMAQYRDVQLDSSMSPRDLAKVLGPPHYLDSASGITNAVWAIWWRRAVDVKIKTDNLGRQEEIYSIGIEDPFPGSLNGIHIGDPVSRLTGDPEKLKREGNYGWDGMAGNWAWNAKAGRITRICHYNERYLLMPVDR